MHETSWAETRDETETSTPKTETRPRLLKIWPRRDQDRDVGEPRRERDETLVSRDETETRRLKDFFLKYYTIFCIVLKFLLNSIQCQPFSIDSWALSKVSYYRFSIDSSAAFCGWANGANGATVRNGRRADLCTRRHKPRPETRPRRQLPRPRRDRDVLEFGRDETETRRHSVSRPSRDRDVKTETTTLEIAKFVFNPCSLLYPAVVIYKFESMLKL